MSDDVNQTAPPSPDNDQDTSTEPDDRELILAQDGQIQEWGYGSGV